MGSKEGTADDAHQRLVEARRDLLKVVERLDLADWDKPTLCEGWRVRDAVSHVADAPDLKLRRVVPGMVRARGDVDRMVDDFARAGGDRDPAEIVEQLRANIESRKVPPGSDLDKLLADVVVHSLDVCQPNGWELDLPADRARHVLSTLVELSGTVRGKERSEGLHLDTTDIDWRCGCGEHVRGPAPAMILALAGRPVCDQLHGEGVAHLAERP